MSEEENGREIVVENATSLPDDVAHDLVDEIISEHEIVEGEEGNVYFDFGESGAGEEGSGASGQIAQIEDENDEESNPYYETGMWSGLPQWKCKLCRWDTLDGVDAMVEHVYQRHLKPEQQRKAKPESGLVVADSRGRVQ